MSSIFTCDLELGQIVYLKTDLEELPRMITGIQFCAGGSEQYQLSCAGCFTWHYSIEISVEKSTIEVLA
jgi:hypothetical protein